VSQITVTALEPGHFGVEVEEGHVTTSHQVAVPAVFLDNLGLPDVDQTELVEETFRFRLDREPADAILRSFPIDQVARYFPDFYDEMRTRLGS
jgi:hypothetical protein